MHAYLQVHWEPVTKENEFGLLPTPLASTGDRRAKFKQGGTPLLGALLPTPCSRDHKGPQTKGFKERGYGALLPDAFTQTGDNMSLNPSFVEEMMGYPIGYTDLKH
tara:strand:- start:3 stop:320 length:318 start_codon:yes stop_codon:yes gene_type:complete